MCLVRIFDSDQTSDKNKIEPPKKDTYKSDKLKRKKNRKPGFCNMFSIMA